MATFEREVCVINVYFYDVFYLEKLHLVVSHGDGDCRQQVLDDHCDGGVDESAVRWEVLLARLELVQPLWQDGLQHAVQPDVLGFILRGFL